MDSIKIPYQKTGYFSNTMLDYLDEKQEIRPFYNKFPSIDNFKDQITEKGKSFLPSTRAVLVNALQKQYLKIETSTTVKSNINQLGESNTYTITTGHQLNLFSGPLYFLYKIISVINLCKELKQAYPQNNFVPIYWMASEDHDFEEIQYFNFKNHKVTWNKDGGGAVGRLSTDSLDKVYNEFSSLLNSSDHANNLRRLFKDAYLGHQNLAEASRYLVNSLFAEYGLVIVDGDDILLKPLFKSYAVKELKEQVTFREVTKTNKLLSNKGYKIQVNPREINLFYIGEGYRERIVKEGTYYKVNNTDKVFNSVDEVFNNFKKLEFVSGNALLRPLYQEVILPNLCYVGGGGELAYWLQLKSTFNSFEVPFPMLLLRNSALIVSEKQKKKADKLEIDIEELFLSQTDLIAEKIKKSSDIEFSFKEKREQLIDTFNTLKTVATKTDKSFTGAVKAQEVKQLKGLANLEKRLLKAEKRKMHDVVTRIELLQNELFPNKSLQERQHNFSEYYEAFGPKLIKEILKHLSPLEGKFTVIIDGDK